MKNYSGRTQFQWLLSYCLPLILLVLVSACKKDTTIDDPTVKLIGTWHQTSRTKDNISAAKDSSRLILQIKEDNICILCDSSKVAVKAKTIIKTSGWSYTAGILNIAVDLPASWSAIAEPNILTLERLDFKNDGALVKTTLTFERVANIEIQ